VTDQDPEARIAAYLESLTGVRHPELVAMETRARESGFPIIGPAVGQFCLVVARLIGARRIFEMGSGYGYSTAWFARAVAESGDGRGEVHHVVWDEALSREARERLGRMGYGGLIRYHVGEATEVLGAQTGDLDLVFLDIDKRGYPGALPVIASHLRPGGVLLVDNALWHGRIFDPSDETPDTDGVRHITEMLTGSSDWDVTLVPIRDGVLLARRR